MRDDRYREQRYWGARILEYEYKGMRVVFLENEKLRVGVLVDKGTDIIEFNHKPTDTDFVWLAPGGVTALSIGPSETLGFSLRADVLEGGNV